MKEDSNLPGWTFKKHQEGYILGSAALFLFSGLAAVYLRHWLLFLIWLACGVWLVLILYFFRDPERAGPYQPELIYSPGDGVVKDITQVRDDNWPDRDFTRVGIFLSVLDVHVQRAPLAGQVVFINHQEGKNHPAYSPEASLENDQILMGIESSLGLVLVKQISGILARKCVNFARVGDRLSAGQRFGLIKLGSRVELYLPEQARLLCGPGDKVQAGITPLAEIKPARR